MNITIFIRIDTNDKIRNEGVNSFCYQNLKGKVAAMLYGLETVALTKRQEKT